MPLRFLLDYILGYLCSLPHSFCDLWPLFNIYFVGEHSYFLRADLTRVFSLG